VRRLAGASRAGTTVLRRRFGGLRDDAGSAVVESALVLVLVAVLFAALLQIGFVLHVRNTLVASAAEGARYGANADRTPEDGATWARTLITDALGDRYAGDVTAGYETVGGVATVVVVVRAPVPLLGPLGIADSLEVRGHAYEEDG
jgi:Flp pilus assembly protein TadG